MRSVLRISSVGAFLTLFCVVALVAGPATASSSSRSSATTEGSLPIPSAFRLPASNGYMLYVVVVPPHSGRPSSLLIFASTKGKGVFYLAPATVTETSMQADLGELGEISVTFHPTDQPTSFLCGKRTIRFDSGQYEGKIDFHGEEGYTSVEATAVPGNIDYFASRGCGKSYFDGGSSGHPRGATLYVRNPALGPELSVGKRRPGAAARIFAWAREYNNGISIQRFAGMRMPGADFRYDRHLRTATVSPPAPFAGSAHFDLGKKAGQRWSGDLTVDLPGRAGTPLTGPTLRATLSPGY
jgi:hypothetical protein